MSSYNKLIEKIKTNDFKVGVLGLGYVGLPLAVLFAKKDVNVLGFEKSEEKVDLVNAGKNYIGDVDDEELKQVVQSERFTSTTDFSRIKECQALIICVPTPLDRFKKPDMSYIEGACREIGKYMATGTFISLESTTYPTTTEDFMLPILEKEFNLQHGQDFWLCYSPERVDPGNHDFKTENTPKVLGGLGEQAAELGMEIYGKAIRQIYKVSSPRIAEMVKILENTYRLVNISLINELTLLAGKMDINMWEVIEAAKSKPFGFQAFYPGPGIGGHCIPLDPFYLEYIAKKYQFDLTLINTAGHIDMLMPHRMTIKINTILNREKKAINGSKIMVLGVAYKPDIADERESPALKIIDEIATKGAEVFYHDPYIPEIETENGRSFQSVELTNNNIKDMDLVIFVTRHSSFDVDRIVDNAQLVLDLRNAVSKVDDKIYKF